MPNHCTDAQNNKNLCLSANTGYNTAKSAKANQEKRMLNPKKLEEIAKQITESLPPGVKNLAGELENKTKQVLQKKLASMDFVSREEFDVQTQVLMRTREKLEMLEKKVAEMEQTSAPAVNSAPEQKPEQAANE